MKTATIKYAAYIAAIGAGAAVVYLIVAQGKKAGVAIATVADAINPVSHTNLAAKSFDAATQWITGDPNVTFGTKLFEWFNPAAVAAEKAALAPNGTPDKTSTLFTMTSDDNGNPLPAKTDPVPSGPTSMLFYERPDGVFFP
jgi:hypothetical protein